MNRTKYIFFQQGFEFLRQWIDVHRIRPLSQKMDAIIDAIELKSYLGLLNYYCGKCVPHLATSLHSFHDLLQKDTPWRWTEECENDLKRSKLQP